MDLSSQVGILVSKHDVVSMLSARILTQFLQDPELEEHRGRLYQLRNLVQSLQYESDKLRKEVDDEDGNLRKRLDRAKKEAILEAAYIDRIEMEQQLSKAKDGTEQTELQDKIRARKTSIKRMEDALGIETEKTK